MHPLCKVTLAAGFSYLVIMQVAFVITPIVNKFHPVQVRLSTC